MHIAKQGPKLGGSCAEEPLVRMNNTSTNKHGGYGGYTYPNGSVVSVQRRDTAGTIDRSPASSRLPDAGVLSLLKRLRDELKVRGIRGFAALSRRLRQSMNKQATATAEGALLTGDFKAALREIDMRFSDKELELLFTHLEDRETNSSISGGSSLRSGASFGHAPVHEETFMEALREPITEERMRVIKDAFDRVDPTGCGQVAPQYLVAQFNANLHPEVIARRRTAEDVYVEFLETFDFASPLPRPSQRPASDEEEDDNAQATSTAPTFAVTRKDFVSYFANLSTTIESDEYFYLLMTKVWNIRLPENKLASMGKVYGTTDGRTGVSRDVKLLVTLTDGSQAIELVEKEDLLRRCENRPADQAAKMILRERGVESVSVCLLPDRDGPTGEGSKLQQLSAGDGARRRSYVLKAPSAAPGVLPGTTGRAASGTPQGGGGRRRRGRRGRGGGGGGRGDGGGGEPDEFDMSYGLLGIVKKLKGELTLRGVKGVAGLTKNLRLADCDLDGRLTLGELKRVMTSMQANLDDAEIRLLFDHFDYEGCGLTDLEDVCAVLRGQMSEDRRAIVKLAFARMDPQGEGVVDPGVLASRFDGTRHPEVIAGRMTPQEVYQEFLDIFACNERAGVATAQDFMEYYENVSAVVESDSYFELLIRNCWSAPSSTTKPGTPASTTTASAATISNNIDQRGSPMSIGFTNHHIQRGGSGDEDGDDDDDDDDSGGGGETSSLHRYYRQEPNVLVTHLDGRQTLEYIELPERMVMDNDMGGLFSVGNINCYNEQSDWLLKQLKRHGRQNSDGSGTMDDAIQVTILPPTFKRGNTSSSGGSRGIGGGSAALYQSLAHVTGTTPTSTSTSTSGPPLSAHRRNTLYRTNASSGVVLPISTTITTSSMAAVMGAGAGAVAWGTDAERVGSGVNVRPPSLAEMVTGTRRPDEMGGQWNGRASGGARRQQDGTNRKETAMHAVIDSGMAFMLKKFKELLVGKYGDVALLRLTSALMAVDEEGNGQVSMGNFRRALKGLNLPLTEADVRTLATCASGVGGSSGGGRDGGDGGGGRRLYWEDFVQLFRSPFSDERMRLIKLAFEELQFQFQLQLQEGATSTPGATADRSLPPEVLLHAYDATRHPDVTSGRKGADEMLREFSETFVVGWQGTVSEANFIGYYTDISAAVADDSRFEWIVRGPWCSSSSSSSTPPPPLPPSTTSTASPVRPTTDPAAPPTTQIAGGGRRHIGSRDVVNDSQPTTLSVTAAPPPIAAGVQSKVRKYPWDHHHLTDHLGSDYTVADSINSVGPPVPGVAGAVRASSHVTLAGHQQPPTAGTRPSGTAGRPWRSSKKKAPVLDRGLESGVGDILGGNIDRANQGTLSGGSGDGDGGGIASSLSSLPLSSSSSSTSTPYKSGRKHMDSAATTTHFRTGMKVTDEDMYESENHDQRFAHHHQRKGVRERYERVMHHHIQLVGGQPQYPPQQQQQQPLQQQHCGRSGTARPLSAITAAFAGVSRGRALLQQLKATIAANGIPAVAMLVKAIRALGGVDPLQQHRTGNSDSHQLPDGQPLSLRQIRGILESLKGQGFLKGKGQDDDGVITTSQYVQEIFAVLSTCNGEGDGDDDDDNDHAAFGRGVNSSALLQALGVVPLSERRDRAVRRTFLRISDHNRELLPAALIAAYDPSEEYDVVTGLMSCEEKSKEFQEHFEMGPRKSNHGSGNCSQTGLGSTSFSSVVSVEDFVRYYIMVSALIPDDSNFEQMLSAVWKNTTTTTTAPRASSSSLSSSSRTVLHTGQRQPPAAAARVNNAIAPPSAGGSAMTAGGHRHQLAWADNNSSNNNNNSKSNRSDGFRQSFYVDNISDQLSSAYVTPMKNAPSVRNAPGSFQEERVRTSDTWVSNVVFG